ncbi:hypoxanthine phosphoribosyltransferase [Dissulfurirhabdus thermomarina]|uniref:Hypoxanthine phosphoribosyltransferase n=1 Tax=Dissulfurirhabdus thermomarina TaxID=1765737 RepID=A0A6N9TVP1_DISTH|nr:hypoxanthine phosphoribosyltransferase [Dissulfurirhabdus thermomarina]NDY42556.1 hypoxanthine phosphoribosyltransferase [Dissulfurirhabdus thermomarina]NMX23685.1 hypoxanthine phosphoribosyltransferase [Dissulfurirhabdus thermomarina]
MHQDADELEELISPDRIRARVRELGDEISRDYEGRPLVVVGILKGAFIFMADLVRHIRGPLVVDFVRLASYGSGTRSTGEVHITKDIEVDVEDRDVLVVEDIVDTGTTLRYLEEVLKLHKPRSVRICCLIDKKERRETDVSVHYVGFDVPRGFLVGYGLDFDEHYRHLPGIYRLRPGYHPEGFRPSEK